MKPVAPVHVGTRVPALVSAQSDQGELAGTVRDSKQRVRGAQSDKKNEERTRASPQKRPPMRGDSPSPPPQAVSLSHRVDHTGFMAIDATAMPIASAGLALDLAEACGRYRRRHGQIGTSPVLDDGSALGAGVSEREGGRAARSTAGRS